MTDPRATSLSKSVLAARARLEERLGHRFTDRDIYDEALTHPSTMTTRGPQLNNQRLEFLGDRVIGLVIADALFASTDKEREGHLTRRYADCVENARLAQIARELDMGPALHVQANTNLADTDKVLADALEAVIGAIWRDGGMDAARRVIYSIWGEMITADQDDAKDHKTRLQEHAHRVHVAPPKYTIIDRKGPDHAPVFTINVQCADRDAQATGPSRRQAEQNAAATWLEELSS
ncbi:MAG: ribonuclease III [Alphaproteobacteria bacterium]|nr:ribonuclease III [Alphaproteobacteria bacterium]